MTMEQTIKELEQEFEVLYDPTYAEIKLSAVNPYGKWGAWAEAFKNSEEKILECVLQLRKWKQGKDLRAPHLP